MNPPPPHKPPPPPPPPPPDLGDGDGDELTIGIGSILVELQQILVLLQQLTAAGMKPIDYTVCCHAIALGIGALVKVVTQISVKLSAPGPAAPPALDLTAVITELECVCSQLTAISTSSATVATDLAPGLKSIADAVANAKPTDVSQIVEQLKKLFKTLDTPKAVYDQLVKDGFLDSKYAQLAGGGDTAPGAVAVAATERHTWWYRFVHGEAGTDAYGLPDYPDSHAPIKDQAANLFKQYISATDDTLAPILKPLIDLLAAQLKPTGPVSAGIINVDAETPLATAVGIATTAAVGAWLMSYLGIDAGECLAHIAELVAGMVGFQEIRDVQIGPLIEHGIAKVAQNNAKATFRQEIPGIGALAALRARALITQEQYDSLHGYSGVPGELTTAFQEAGETGLPPFLMIRLSGTGLFSDADIADELTFRGIRPTSQHRFIAAAAFLRTQPERNKFLATLEKVYAAGLISDANFLAGIDSAAHNTDIHDLSLRTVQLEKQIALAKEYEAAYSHEFLSGLLDAPSYQSALEALGMQPPDVAARLFRDQTHLTVTQTLGAERAARAATRKTQAEARKAAIEGFRTGTIDATGLTAALNLAGLTPAQTAAEVAYQLLASSGTLRWIYGRHLSPQEATLLRQQVQDLTRQREIQMLTDAQYVSQLQALKIPPRYIQALRAGANAHISPKINAILTPPTVP